MMEIRLKLVISAMLCTLAFASNPESCGPSAHESQEDVTSLLQVGPGSVAHDKDAGWPVTAPVTFPTNKDECHDFCALRDYVSLCDWECAKALREGTMAAFAGSKPPMDFKHIAKAWQRRADPIQSKWDQRNGMPQQMGGRWPAAAKVGGTDDTAAASGIKAAQKWEES